MYFPLYSYLCLAIELVGACLEQVRCLVFKSLLSRFLLFCSSDTSCARAGFASSQYFCRSTKILGECILCLNDSFRTRASSARAAILALEQNNLLCLMLGRQLLRSSRLCVCQFAKMTFYTIFQNPNVETISL